MIMTFIFTVSFREAYSTKFYHNTAYSGQIIAIRPVNTKSESTNQYEKKKKHSKIQIVLLTKITHQ